MPNALELLAAPALLVLLVPALFALAIPYVVLALRDSRSVVCDPQVGWKAGLYFMFSLSILMALVAATLLVLDLFTNDPLTPRRIPVPPRQTEQQRVAYALLTSALIIGLVHLCLILFASNSRQYPAARRVFVGCRLAVHSLVVLAAFTVLVYQFYQPLLDRDTLKTPISILLVWVPSWLCHLVLLRVYSTSPAAPAGRGLPLPPSEHDE